MDSAAAAGHEARPFSGERDRKFLAVTDPGLLGFPLGPPRGRCLSGERGNFAPLLEGPDMKSRELQQAIRLISKLSDDPGLKPGQGDRLRKAKREFEAVARSGKLDERRIFRAVEIVTTVLLEIVERDAI